MAAILVVITIIVSYSETRYAELSINSGLLLTFFKKNADYIWQPEAFEIGNVRRVSIIQADITPAK